MAYSAKSIANGLLRVSQERGHAISNMKLQKLLYFAHGFWLANTGVPLIGELPQAWQYGPVYPSVYHEFKHCGSGPIERPATEIDFSTLAVSPVPLPDENVMAFLGAVYNSYGTQTAIQLSAISHLPGSPWAKTWNASGGASGAVIGDGDTKDYFSAWLNQSRPQQVAG